MPTSSNKFAANKGNAKRSTGPVTAEGKRRASRNAFRHGLATSVLADPELSLQVDKLTAAICGQDGNPERRVLAREIATAEVDLVRIRNVRTRFFDQLVRPSVYDSNFSKVFGNRDLLNHRNIEKAGGGDVNETTDKFQEVMSVIDSLNRRYLVKYARHHLKCEPVNIKHLELERRFGRGAMFQAVVQFRNFLGPLLSFDRYERRATSRRDCAIFAYENAKP